MNLQFSPLRYPGGKQRLAPFVEELIDANDLRGGHYAEPYAGGAGVAMYLLLTGVVSRVHINDASTPVYAFWRAILRFPEEFCRMIARTSLTVDEWKRQRSVLSYHHRYSQLEVGFSVFYLNRCNRSGIFSAGPIGGYDQSGKWKIDARFSRSNLISRIERIAAKQSSITVKNMDAEDFMLDYLPTLPQKTFVYCDPPYYHKADRLYLNHYKPKDHARIAQTIQCHVCYPWAVSYDAADEILVHYAKRRSFLYGLQYNAAKAYKGREVFFFSDKIKLPQHSAVNYIDTALTQVA
ncbi:MAG: DNA adenine methylase [Phycisphaerales bacterium]